MSYKKSKVYQLGYKLIIRVERLCANLPRREQYCLAQQLREASRSIVANYVEGYVRQGRFPADHRRFVMYSQGSCDETKFWLELVKDISLGPPKTIDEFLRDYGELGRLLHTLMNTRRKR